MFRTVWVRLLGRCRLGLLTDDQATQKTEGPGGGGPSFQAFTRAGGNNPLGGPGTLFREHQLLGGGGGGGRANFPFTEDQGRNKKRSTPGDTWNTNHSVSVRGINPINPAGPVHIGSRNCLKIGTRIPGQPLWSEKPFRLSPLGFGLGLSVPDPPPGPTDGRGQIFFGPCGFKPKFPRPVFAG